MVVFNLSELFRIYLGNSPTAEPLRNGQK